jgi:GT2 family glycosyltransferase
MGGASAWRSKIFRQHQFSPSFSGYGLYEDLDFCLSVSREGPLYLCTRARLAHYHATSGRPNHFRYGEMVVRNGWFVWRKCWPAPPLPDRLRWWAITILLMLCQLGDVIRGPFRTIAVEEILGRLWGIAKVFTAMPMKTREDENN